MLKVDELIHDSIKTVGISGHILPDGDCIGSCMGLYLYLKKNYPSLRVDVFFEEEPPELKIIKDIDVVRHDFKTDVEQYDLFFLLDVEKGRTGGAEPLFDNAKCKINIDHHVSNPGCGDINYIRTNASSVCEMMCEVLDFERMDKDIAETLYTGIVTDTGMFHYSCTSPLTMRIAARLMEFGFAASDLVEHVELERRYAQNKALGFLLTRSSLHLGDRVISSYIELSEMEEQGFGVQDLDGAVSELNLTSGVLCSLLAHGDASGGSKISLRSKTDDINVAKIAEAFSGGGHIRASGCSFEGSAADAVQAILPHVEAQLANIPV
ncbi:MAG: bifunctional oligoribonuclease/PAP phosphatase NrnA [Lachnospiraceae bacterium]|nr:bifunctional oligoribonuclease/PAP phosphatase NrnA [Lachnospiraceae bacterium]